MSPRELRPASSRTLSLASGLLGVLVLWLAGDVAHARPLYFDNLVALYGFAPGDDLYACGVCHKLWTGTGPRNAFGTAVEQQLYIGKPIHDAILAVEPGDADFDGFTNVEELSVFGTLPGFSCDNFREAVDPPASFQSLITPGVPTCLEPKDIGIAPLEVTFVAEVGEAETATVEVVNDGSDDPITINAVSFLPGGNATLSVAAPALPRSIPVGGSETLIVTWDPVASGAASGTLRIESDDPDEPVVDISINGLAFVLTLSPAADRAACLKDIDARFRRYSKKHVSEWGRCHLDELGNVACDAGRRDVKLARAEEGLRKILGGEADRNCEARNISPARLGLPSQCPAPCDGIPVSSLPQLGSCLVCQQQAASDLLLEAALGTTTAEPPVTPLASEPARCARKIQKKIQSTTAKIQRLLARCELENVTASSPVDCASALAPRVAELAGRVDVLLDRCPDTAGLSGCRFQPGASNSCLGDAASGVASDLVEAVFGNR